MAARIRVMTTSTVRANRYAVRSVEEDFIAYAWSEVVVSMRLLTPSTLPLMVVTA